MSYTKLLHQLATIERETDLQYHARWDELAQGTLPDVQADELIEAAAHSERGRALRNAFAPLDAAAHSRILQSAMAGIPMQPGALHAVASQRRQRLLIGLAIAAALCLTVLLRGSGKPREPVAALSPVVTSVPAYRLEVLGGDTPGVVRAADLPPELPNRAPRQATLPTLPTLLGAGASFGLVLRPDTPVDQPVEILSCSIRDGRVGPWNAPWERADSGSFHVEGSRETLFAGEPPGEVTLALAVGNKASLPSCAALVPPAQSPESVRLGYTVLTHRVAIR